MYEYFGVGPQVLEDIGNMYPRFLHWLPKYHLSTPPKHSFQTWRMVVDNLAANDVSFFVFFFCFFVFLLLLLLLLLFCFLLKKIFIQNITGD